MKVKISEKELRETVRKVIAEEMPTLNTYQKVSDELDRSNEEDRKRIEQEMAADWAELERINAQFQNQGR